MNSIVEVIGKSESNLGSSNRRKIAGFTLVELMIVVVIVAIGLSLALPSFSTSLSLQSEFRCCIDRLKSHAISGYSPGVIFSDAT
jgi:prepilin-type N-terminal cleavage/methylation domain-containing protein